MADLTAHVIRTTEPRGETKRLPIADGENVYVGGLIGAEAGFGDSWAGGVNDVFMGVAMGGKNRDRTNDDLLGETDDTPDPHVVIDTSGVTLTHLASVGGSPLQTKVGNQVYCTTDNTNDMTMDPAGSGIIQSVGYLSHFESATDLDVTLFTPAEYLAKRGNTYSLTWQVDLASVTAADVVTNFAIPHRFKVVDFQYVTGVAGSGSDNATFTLEIGATAITGASILIDDNTGTVGIVLASAALTALNVGAAGDTLTLVAGTVTTFASGSGTFIMHIQDLGI